MISACCRVPHSSLTLCLVATKEVFGEFIKPNKSIFSLILDKPVSASQMILRFLSDADKHAVILL